MLQWTKFGTERVTICFYESTKDRVWTPQFSLSLRTELTCLIGMVTWFFQVFTFVDYSLISNLFWWIFPLSKQKIIGYSWAPQGVPIITRQCVIVKDIEASRDIALRNVLISDVLKIVESWHLEMKYCVWLKRALMKTTTKWEFEQLGLVQRIKIKKKLGLVNVHSMLLSWVAGCSTCL